jgi:ubiquinone/menaquinone biosynthesis C-methylase UbiE
MPKVRHLLKLGVVAATSRSTRVFYDRVSEFYESVFTDHLVHAETMSAVLCQAFPRPDTAAVLDLGCGTGTMTRRLQEQGFRASGLDFSFESLRRLRKAAESIPTVQADAIAHPFGSASFDAVTCLGAWRHFPDPQHVMDEICRVLRPNGIVLVGYFPPKLGGLFSVPSGIFGRTVIALYRFVIRLVNQNDRIDGEMERGLSQMLNRAFVTVRRIKSGKNSYVLFAAAPCEPNQEVRE